ncbi:MAG: hypothetical protein ACLU4B_02410 [Bilophila wadsworthia]
MSAALFWQRPGSARFVTRARRVAIGSSTIDVLGYRSDSTPLTSPFDGRQPVPAICTIVGRRPQSCPASSVLRRGGCPYLCNNEQNTRVTASAR